MVYIFDQYGKVIGDMFRSHNEALEFISNNTGLLDNGVKFAIVDFANDCSSFYQTRLTMTFELI